MSPVAGGWGRGGRYVYVSEAGRIYYTYPSSESASIPTPSIHAALRPDATSERESNERDERDEHRGHTRGDIPHTPHAPPRGIPHPDVRRQGEGMPRDWPSRYIPEESGEGTPTEIYPSRLASGDIPLRRYTPPETGPRDWSPRLVLGYWSQTRPPAPPPPGTGTAPRHRPRHRHRTTLLGLAPRRGCRPVPGVVRYRHTQRTRPSDRNTTCRPSPTCS